MKKLKHPLLTNNYTAVLHEEDFNFHAPHNFLVVKSEAADDFVSSDIVGNIHFQEGPIKENGVNAVNGVCNEDLIGMVICRLEYFQQSPFACDENAIAITRLEEALKVLRARTEKRKQRGVEGTHEV